jgi:release factor glutamine methyltransferase
MKSHDAILCSMKRLTEAGRDEARLKAELLVAHVLGQGRLETLAQADRPLSTEQAGRVEVLTGRVAAGEPLQYVLGEAWFWGRRFKTDARALIPRPETEELVQRVLDDAGLWRCERPVVVDVGVGTGCIALTLAAERPQAHLIGVDLHAEALELARENEAALGLAGRVEWRQADLLAGQPAGTLDAVVSNPPYIASAAISTLAEEVRAHEPRSALDGGPDGLDLIRRLIAQANLALRPGGKVWMEIGDEQGEAVRGLLIRSGWIGVELRRDLAGQDRIVEGRRA